MGPNKRGEKMSLILVAALLLQGLGFAPPSNGLPDLHVILLDFHPSNPIFLAPITVEVVVENHGRAPSGGTSVSLEWCCGTISRFLPSVPISGTAEVTFEQILMFAQPGEYEITATVDPQNAVTEEDETDNSRIDTLTVSLWPSVAPPASEDLEWVPADWGDHPIDLICPDTDLMRIGRRVPLAVQDLCPEEWGPPINHGCPLPDPDGDTVPNAPIWYEGLDLCPEEPGPKDNDGCPVAGTPGDPDGDTITHTDVCTDVWGLAATPGVDDGCPRPNEDGDGWLDANDPCVDEAGPGGCPIPGQAGDADGDGVSDAALAWIDDPHAPESGRCRAEYNQQRHLGCQIYLRGQRGPACGTTSLAYVLRYLDRTCDGEPCTQQLVDREIRMYWEEGGEAEGMFTDPTSIVRYVRQHHGLNAEIYVDGDVDEIRWFVELGIPVMLQISWGQSTNILDGVHWTVPVAFCETGAFPIGTAETSITFYEPNGWQLRTTPDLLTRFWGKATLGDLQLWNRMYIAISDEDLPPGDTDEVEAALATAQAMSNFMSGLEKTWNGFNIFGGGGLGDFVEGLAQMSGAIPTAIVGALSVIVGVLEDSDPLIGGVLGALADYAGGLALATQDLANTLAELVNINNWGDGDTMRRLFVDLFTSMGEMFGAAVGGLVEFIVDVARSIWGGLKALGCAWFNRGCPKKVSYHKHYASFDPCMESWLFVNGLFRTQPVGYVHDHPAPDMLPIYLYAEHLPPAEPTDVARRGYYLCPEGDWPQPDPKKLQVGLVGYTDATTATASIDLATLATDSGIGICPQATTLGYLDAQAQPDSSMLWLVQPLGAYSATVTADPCASTETFINPLVQGYTREIAVGWIPSSETEGTRRLYRFYGPDSWDIMLSTWIPASGGFSLSLGRGDRLAAGDVNGDGRAEIIHGDADGPVRIFDIDGNDLPSLDLGFGRGDLLGAGDLDGDGRDDIVHADVSVGRIRAYEVEIIYQAGIHVTLAHDLGSLEQDFDDVAVGDVDGDGTDEIVLGDAGHDRIHAYAVDGSYRGGFLQDYDGNDILACGDVNGDGRDDILQGDQDEGRIRVLSLRPGDYDLGGFDLRILSLDALAAGDIDGDGREEIIHASPESWISAFAMDGTLVQEFMQELAHTGGSAVGDVDGDGIDEVIYYWGGQILVNPMFEGYVNTGYLGSIYTEQQPRTVPLYQYYNAKRRDHLITLDPSEPPEGMEGYSQREILGYVLPPEEIAEEDTRCHVPLWRFCTRIWTEE